MVTHPGRFIYLACDAVVLPIDKISAAFLLEDRLNRVIIWLASHGTVVLLARGSSGWTARLS